tara:strand:+ start:168 stop:332 length:165 start_codon:yes stop_codon:yes gene_type:complete
MYNVRLIKDRPPYKEGQTLVGVSIESYNNLYKGGFIDDEHKLIKVKKTKKKIIE